jgi:hypothetical protein
MEQLNRLQQFFTRFSFRGIIAMIVVVGSFAFLFTIVYHPIPEANKESVNMAMGFDLAALGIVIGWYFGSSKEKSDQDKAATINSAIDKSE